MGRGPSSGTGFGNQKWEYENSSRRKLYRSES